MPLVVLRVDEICMMSHSDRWLNMKSVMVERYGATGKSVGSRFIVPSSSSFTESFGS